MNPRSIRFRLATWHAAILTAVFILLGALFFARLKSYLESAILDAQERRARQIGETLIASIPSTGEAALAGQIEALYAPERSDRFIRVTRQDGTVLYVSGPPNDQSFEPARVSPAKQPGAQPEFTRTAETPDGGNLLIAGFHVVTSGGGYLVEVGTASEPVSSLLNQMALLLAAGLPIVILVAAGGGYVLVRRALRPVDLIAGKAELITQHNLGERVPVARTGDELERLAESLNRMITRLDDAFQNSKRFVADASHELRTPLTILRGELETLAQDARLRGDIADRLGSLLEEVERLTKIVERLFALSRLDAGEAQAEWVRFDLASMAATTAEQMNVLAEEKKISLRCEAEASVYVDGDRARLKQVVVNLVDNAIKYTPEAGAIRVRTKAIGDRAILEVADTGIGIPAAALHHVFERFFRVDPSRSRRPDGAGLGLAIVRSICSAHGGSVEAESAVGLGSKFRVKLPLAKEISTSSSNEAFEPNP
jgi:heavy metal sensor kinase